MTIKKVTRRHYLFQFMMLLLAISTLSACSGCSSNSADNDPDGNTSAVPQVNFTSAAITVDEGNAGVPVLRFDVHLDKAVDTDININYISMDGTATAPLDYTAANGTLIIPPGETVASIEVAINPEHCYEPDETFTLTLDSVSANAILGSSTSATGTIINDDPRRVVTIQSATQEEGDDANDMPFNVTLDSASCQDISFTYSTSNGGGLATNTTDDNDLTHQSNATLTLPAGLTQATIHIELKGDDVTENTETFTLAFSGIPDHATLTADSVTGTIIDDDGGQGTPPVADLFSILGTAMIEADSGSMPMMFTVTLQQAAAQIVTIDYITESGSATGGTAADSGVDYIDASGTLIFQPGDTEKTLTVTVIGDEIDEGNETFTVRLSNVTGLAATGTTSAQGRIEDDDQPTTPAKLSVQDASRLEGDSGTSTLEFIVTLDKVVNDIVSVQYTTTAQGDTDTSDYVDVTGTVQIAANSLSTTITVTINGDVDNETDDSFELALSNLSANAVFQNDSAIGTIINDDGLPGWQTPELLGPGWKSRMDSDAGGNAVAAWFVRDDPSKALDAIQSAHFVNGIWQQKRVIDFPEYSRASAGDLSLVTTGNGNAIVLWRSASIRGTLESSIYNATNDTWTESTISANGDYDDQKIVGNTAGEGFAVWADIGQSAGTEPKNWLARYDPVNGWDTPLQLVATDANATQTKYAQSASIDIDADGNAMAVWVQYFTDYSTVLYYRYFDAVTGTWGLALPIPNSDDPSQFNWDRGGHSIDQLSLYPNGTGDAVMLAGGRLWFYDRASRTWTNFSEDYSSNLSLGHAIDIRFVIDANDDLVLAWNEVFQNVYVRRFDNQTGRWKAPIQLTSPQSNRGIGSTDIAMDAEGNVIVVWTEDVNAASFPDPTQYRVRASRYSVTSDSWSNAEIIDDASDPERGSSDPEIAIDATGNAFAIWKYDKGDEREIGSARYVPQ